MKILPKIHVIFIVLTHNHGNEACDMQNAQKACDLEQIQQGSEVGLGKHEWFSQPACDIDTEEKSLGRWKCQSLLPSLELG